jgi:hypothetical protein
MFKFLKRKSKSEDDLIRMMDAIMADKSKDLTKAALPIGRCIGGDFGMAKSGNHGYAVIK